MAWVYSFKHGRKQDLAKSPLKAPAEPIVTIDTNELFFGWGEGKPITQLNADKANSLWGQTVTVAELNYLTGANANIQAQINTINNLKADKTGVYSRTEVDDMYNHLMVTKLQIADFEQGVSQAVNTMVGAPNGIAPLDADGKVPMSYIGMIALSGGIGVSSDAEQCALGPDKLIAVRVDLNKTYVRNGMDTGTMSDWLLMKTPTDAVSSVAGKSGNVVLLISDVQGLANALLGKSDVGHSHDYQDITNKPDLSSLHAHDNLNVLAKLSETAGTLQYNGQPIISNTTVNNYNAKTKPGISNDVTEGFSPGSHWLDNTTGMEYVCVNNSIGNAVWKSTTNLDGDTGMPKLFEVDTNIVVGGNSSQMVTLPIGFDKYDIRTIYAKSLEGNNISVSIYDAVNDGFMIYQSLTKSEIYDIVNVPCADKDADKSMHVVVNNSAISQTTVHFIAKVTSLA